MTARDIAPAAGKLGILTPGMGAVASTFIAGVLAARQGISAPIGSVSQMAHIRLGTKEENRNPLIKEFVPLAELDDIVFGGWDPISSNAMEAAKTAGVLEGSDLDAISAEMEGIVPMEAVFDQRWVSRLDGVRVKDIPNKWDQAEALITDMARFKEENGCDQARHGVVRLYRGVPGAIGSARHGRLVRAGTARRRREHLAVADLLLRRAAKRCSIRQRCSEPHHRPRLHDRVVEDQWCPDRRKGFQDRPDANEDPARARLQGPHARGTRVVLDQHPRQP